MFKKRSLFTALIAIIFSMVILPHGTAFAAIADGTYSISYEVKEANSENTSIADGYFSKPATLTVKDGVQNIQLTVTSSSMIKDLKAQGSPVTIVSEDEANETRTVSFTVNGDLSQPVLLDMHIVVPDLYDTTHQARAFFDVSGLDQAGAGGETTSSSESSTEKGSGEAEDNPPTGDHSQIGLYTMLLVGSAIAFIAVRKLRPARHS